MYTDKELCRQEKKTKRKSSCAAFSFKEAVFTKYCSDAINLFTARYDTANPVPYLQKGD